MLSAEETRELLDSLDISSVLGLRNRALVALMAYTFARVGAVIAMKVEDYFPQTKRWWAICWVVFTLEFLPRITGTKSRARCWSIPRMNTKIISWPGTKSIQSPASRYVPKSLMPMIGQCSRFCIHAGLARLFDNGVSGPDGGLSLRDTLLVHTLQLQPKAIDASVNEGLSRPETLAQVAAVRSLGSIPLIVLSGARKPAVSLDDESEVELLDRFMDYRVHVTQAHLATLSTRGRQIILENVGHGIPTEAPEAIVNAVRDVLPQR